uniref:RDD domain-containing protein n=1 Tax=Uncultured archaeon GZfos26G2 TaxID=3386331 RepID=Q649C0_UNCAG|nr:hypothetical protein GZ35B7_40 [uncultured archaeon GZfos35B7]
MNEEKEENIETIYLAKWESRFWVWLIDILMVEVFLSLIANGSGFPIPLLSKQIMTNPRG